VTGERRKEFDWDPKRGGERFGEGGGKTGSKKRTNKQGRVEPLKDLSDKKRVLKKRKKTSKRGRGGKGNIGLPENLKTVKALFWDFLGKQVGSKGEQSEKGGKKKHKRACASFQPLDCLAYDLKKKGKGLKGKGEYPQSLGSHKKKKGKISHETHRPLCRWGGVRQGGIKIFHEGDER